MSGTIEFLGAEFHVADKVSSLAFMRFAKVAKAGTDAEDMDGLAAMYDLLQQCIATEDWHRFEAHADTQRADSEQLLEVIQKVFAVLADRPTGRSSDASDGPRIIEPSSTVDSSSPAPAERAISRLNEQGRPDLALLVRRRAESQSA